MELRVGGLKDEDFSFDMENLLASVIVPVSVQSFQQMQELKDGGNSLECCLSTRGVVTNGVERIRVYKFQGAVTDITRERSGTRVALKMETEPSHKTIEL